MEYVRNRYLRACLGTLLLGLIFFVPHILVAQRADSVIVDYLKKEWNVRFSDNNRMVVFKNGQEKFEDLFCAISQARHSVHLEYFNFRNDSISALLFDLLAKKVGEGVEVRAIFDGFGNTSNNRPLKKRHLQDLRDRGIEIYEFDPLKFPWITKALHRDHRKIVVIDGVIAYTGGMNVADYYLEGTPELGDWRDLHVRVEGDVVADLQGVFINFWNKVTRQNLKGTQYYPGMRDASVLFDGLKRDTAYSAGKKMIGMTDRDALARPRIIHDTFIKIINSAEKQLQIINPYFTLCPHVRKALLRAAKRGVDVQIMVSAKSDIPITPRIVDNAVHALMKSGAKIYYYEGGFHHSKIMMVDSVCAYVGSANMNSRSLSFDYECNLFVADSAATRELQDIFEQDKRTRCYQLTPDKWKQISKWKRFMGKVLRCLVPFV